MKLLYCINSLQNSGGMERVLTTKVNYLAEHYDYKVDIALYSMDREPFFPLSQKVTLHNLDCKTKKEYRIRLEQLIMTNRPDITISLYGREYSFLYKIKDGSRKIVEFHFSKYYLTHLVRGIRHLKYRPLHYLKAWFLQKREEYYAHEYDKVVLLTRQDLNLWGNKPNMCFIPNPLSFRTDRTADLSQKRIIAAGRFIAQKGFDLLIDACGLIATDLRDWEINIYGEGQDEDLLKELIRKHRLEKQIVLHSSTAHIQDKMLESSIFVLSSRYEGFGLVLTEAMECGLPCIAFDCECGPGEIIIDRTTGILVSPIDANTLAQAITLLIDSETLRMKYGEKGKEKVACYYLENIMPKWKVLFENIINS